MCLEDSRYTVHVNLDGLSGNSDSSKSLISNNINIFINFASRENNVHEEEEGEEESIQLNRPTQISTEKLDTTPTPTRAEISGQTTHPTLPLSTLGNMHTFATYTHSDGLPNISVRIRPLPQIGPVKDLELNYYSVNLVKVQVRKVVRLHYQLTQA